MKFLSLLNKLQTSTLCNSLALSICFYEFMSLCVSIGWGWGVMKVEVAGAYFIVTAFNQCQIMLRATPNSIFFKYLNWLSIWPAHLRSFYQWYRTPLLVVYIFNCILFWAVSRALFALSNWLPIWKYTSPITKLPYPLKNNIIHDISNLEHSY